ncbi:MAG TPA: hypothetical protein VK892_18470, partial [Pyrinomonadaceae bacterium]|nr:hypothetical protein [Pyrinomonadaceae bacterium]
MKLDCELFAYSDVEHLQQIYTGFSLLHQKGFLRLKQTIPSEFLQNKHEPNRWVDYKFFNTKVIINGKISVCYDTHDWNWIDEQILSEVDFYFKRSFDENFISNLKDSRKVFPLGFNYQVSNSKRDFFKLERAAFYGGKDKIKAVLKGLRMDNFFGGKGETERLDKLESYPDFSLEPKILFMTRAWDT